MHQWLLQLVASGSKNLHNSHMSWLAKLSLNYRLDADRTTFQFQHEGPLRVLQSLYPEGPGVCHNVLVHPPSGLVGGDVLDVQVSVGEGAHGLVLG